MRQAGFTYAPAADVAAPSFRVSIFADRPAVRALLREDCELAGCAVEQEASFGDIAALAAREPGEVVLLDIAELGEGDLAALCELDERAAARGTQLLVSTTVDALDAVFGCLQQAELQLLVAPTRGERVVALGRVMAHRSTNRLRELEEDDRLVLLRLTEQVGQIAERLERLGQQGLTGDGNAFRFESPGSGYKGEGDGERALIRKPRPPLPDARLVRQIIGHRRARARFFDGELFADPAWDILLDLTAARVERKRVSVTSLCIASGVPPTTALRWIAQMTEAGLLERVEDETDKRRAFIQLTEKAVDAMARYFADIGSGAGRLA